MECLSRQVWDRGIEGKILAAKFARENKVPLWEFVLVCRL
jgi:CTP synthase (UTP-ammonia lyase)